MLLRTLIYLVERLPGNAVSDGLALAAIGTGLWALVLTWD